MLQITPLAPTPHHALDLATPHSPYLARLVAQIDQGTDPDQLFRSALVACETDEAGPEELKRTLRIAKKQAHLAIASLDLSGLQDVAKTTRMITDFAEAAVRAALNAACQHLNITPSGLFIAALGKMGAHELNYSSDIDLAAFFDPDRINVEAHDATEAMSRVVKQAMALLSQPTEDGYVFRTDLRLRPDPGSTPLALSTRRAELYYERVGQNWERMVWIKGRVVAGDFEAGTQFLDMLQPFVWRRHLDYWAIADVQAIKKMINAKVGQPTLEGRSPDIKLGAGGIREIEFFVQTQQIILGGRNPALRLRATLPSLAALVELGAVEQAVADELNLAYVALRAVEHRLQMMDDEQTHTLPTFEAKRAALAALCGYSELDRFDADILATRQLVNGHYQALFAGEAKKRQSAFEGNLVFTGVDDDPGTVSTLTGLGFKSPDHLIQRVRQWHRGRTPATRTTRGRELLTALLPDLLTIMGKTDQPDQAFLRFSRFFEGLRSGVQVLSMLVAEPDLLEDIVTTLAIAPRIADTLARRPGVLEALLSVSDRKSPPEISRETEFSDAMDTVRRWHGEQAFLIGHRLLHGKLAARDAAAEWSDLADTCIRKMAFAAEIEVSRRFGPPPGAWAVIGLGKLGGREMTAGSDLDLLVVFDAPGGDDAQVWFTRFTQRLITALSAETGEGSLYEVDMRLRPSGRAGPVATSLTAFRQYHLEQAWTWEHMALTRLRVICGDEALADAVLDAAAEAIANGDIRQRTNDILDMRQRLHREKPASGPWDIKMRDGGLVDLEFIVQHAALTAPTPLAHHPGLLGRIDTLEAAGVFTSDIAETLRQARLTFQGLQQIQRIAIGLDMGAETLSDGTRDRLCRAVRIGSFPELETHLEATCAQVSALFRRFITDRATEIES